MRIGPSGKHIRLAAAAAALAALAANRPAEAQDPAPERRDTAFAELQERGRMAMGVNQYTSRHQFDDLADGGRIELQRDPADTAGVRTIREHLRGIARSFTKGDFSVPGFVHAREVPGTRVMRERRDLIRYEFRPLPGGGEVRVTSTDPAAVAAIHEFLAFQRHDHRAGGSEHGH